VKIDDLADDLHIWYFSLDCERADISNLDRLLSDAERQRVGRLVNRELQNKQIVVRSSVRSILSEYLNLAPLQVEFTIGGHGKPALLNREFEFNLSHAHNLAVLAVCAHYPVGVDLEYVRPIAAADLVARFFAPVEQAAFDRLPETAKVNGFFHAWTQKEAYLKAMGTGLSTPLDRIVVAIDPATPPQVTDLDRASAIPPEWCIESLEHLPPNYLGTAISCGHCQKIEYQIREYFYSLPDETAIEQ
jgi:4'-phosphopantetheinyl transferase